MKFLEKIKECGDGRRADILGDMVEALRASGTLTKCEARRAHLRIQKKVRTELLSMSRDDRNAFIRTYVDEQKARGVLVDGNLLKKICA